MITLFLLDSEELTRRGLASLVQGELDLRVVGEASTVIQSESALSVRGTDIVLSDVELADGSGLDLCTRVSSRDPSIQWIFLSRMADNRTIAAAFDAGANAFFRKDVRGPELLASIRATASRRSRRLTLENREVREPLEGEVFGNRSFDSLSKREREVLFLLSGGLTNRQIGVELSLAEKTVKNYMSGLLFKLGLQHRSQAAIFGWRMGVAN